jgi:hypothetical protein
MSLTLFTGIAELDQEIFTNIDDIVSLRNLYVSCKSLRNHMNNTLVINNIKNKLEISHKIILLNVCSFDDIMDKILHIHYVKMMGKRPFCAFLLKQNRFDLIEKFFNKGKKVYLSLPFFHRGYNGDFGGRSFRSNYCYEEKTYYGLMYYLAKNELLAEMKTLGKHINFTESLAKRLCKELSSDRPHLTKIPDILINNHCIKNKVPMFVKSPEPVQLNLKPSILEYLMELFPSMLTSEDLIFSISDSSNSVVHNILRNNVGWSELYSIIKKQFISCQGLEKATFLLNAYPELYSDNKIIGYVASDEHIFGQNTSSELCGSMYIMVNVHGLGEFYSCYRAEVWKDILNYWHIHHPDKHIWYDKLSQQISVKLGLYHKTSEIINFMQKNPNCSPRDVFKIWSSFIYKDKFITLNQQQPPLSQRIYSQINQSMRRPTKAKRQHYNQPTSHKHQCHNYRK